MTFPDSIFASLEWQVGQVMSISSKSFNDMDQDILM